MHRAVARRAALVTIGLSSVLFGVFLVFSLAARDRINGLSTAHLLAILALLVLPGATYVAWRLDRRGHSAPVPPPSGVPDPALPTRLLHAGPTREPAASHRRDTRPGRTRTP